MMSKKFYAIMAVAAALCSCNKAQIENDLPVIDEGDKNNVIAPLVFTATVEDAPDSKATFDKTYDCASWEVNDIININGYHFYAGSAGTTTTFMSPATKEVRPTYVHSYSGSNAGETPDKLVDAAGTATKWCASYGDRHWSFGNDCYEWDIVVKLDAPAKLYAIKLWNGNDTYSYPGRRWQRIRVWGWRADTWNQSGDSWEVIKIIDNMDLANNQNDLFAGTFQVNANKEYEYYLIDVINVENGNTMQMSDMKFVYELNEGSNNALTMDNAPFHAYFPFTLYDGNTATATLPAHIEEDWVEGKFNMPMYAESATTDLEFKNLCAVLKITVKSDDIASVKSIKVSSSNCATSGTFTVNAENAAVLDNPTDFLQNLTITYNTAVETDAAGKVFYVPIPAQTYRDLLIRLSDGVSYANDKYMVTKSGTDIVVERNKIYPIDFADNYDLPLKGTRTATIGGDDVEVPWVQLWEDGPKFAAYNVGVTDGQPESYGGYYVIGGIQDKGNDYYVENVETLPAEHDTATLLWGENWRMPTGAELQGLIDHCDIERVVVIGSHAGTRFTGRGEYAVCTLFLPATGYCAGGDVSSDYAQNHDDFEGHYWSSTNYYYGVGYKCLNLTRDNTSVEEDMYSRNMSVRAVVK